MLNVTFYSYKGGVGRTLTALNTAAMLADRGLKIVLVDFDLEAPGLGLSRSTESLKERPGVSDILLDWEAGGLNPVSDVLVPLDEHRWGRNFCAIPAGRNVVDLSRKLRGWYSSKEDPHGQLFSLLRDSIRVEHSPDFLIFDSRTGLADIAGIATLELPDVLVVCLGVNEQNVTGMERALNSMFTHKRWRKETSIVFALGLIPVAGHDPQVGKLPLHRPKPTDPVEREKLASGFQVSPIYNHLQRVRTRLDALLSKNEKAVRRRFAHVMNRDRVIAFPYDPAVPLCNELEVRERPLLAPGFEALADCLQRHVGSFKDESGALSLLDILGKQQPEVGND